MLNCGDVLQDFLKEFPSFVQMLSGSVSSFQWSSFSSRGASQGGNFYSILIHNIHISRTFQNLYSLKLPTTWKTDFLNLPALKVQKNTFLQPTYI